MTSTVRKMSIDEGAGHSSFVSQSSSDEFKSKSSVGNKGKMVCNILLVEDVVSNQKQIVQGLLKAKIPSWVALDVYIVDNVEDAIAAATQQTFFATKSLLLKEKAHFFKGRQYSHTSFDIVFMDKQILKGRNGKELDGNGGLIATKTMRAKNFSAPIYSISSAKLDENVVKECGYAADLTKSALDLMKDKISELLIP